MRINVMLNRTWQEKAVPVAAAIGAVFISLLVVNMTSWILFHNTHPFFRDICPGF